MTEINLYPPDRLSESAVTMTEFNQRIAVIMRQYNIQHATIVGNSSSYEYLKNYIHWLFKAGDPLIGCTAQYYYGKLRFDDIDITVLLSDKFKLSNRVLNLIVYDDKDDPLKVRYA